MERMLRLIWSHNAVFIERCTLCCKEICDVHPERRKAGAGMDLRIFGTLSDFYPLYDTWRRKERTTVRTYKRYSILLR